jgi:hypothetical protein
MIDISDPAGKAFLDMLGVFAGVRPPHGPMEPAWQR